MNIMLPLHYDEFIHPGCGTRFCPVFLNGTLHDFVKKSSNICQDTYLAEMLILWSALLPRLGRLSLNIGTNYVVLESFCASFKSTSYCYAITKIIVICSFSFIFIFLLLLLFLILWHVCIALLMFEPLWIFQEENVLLLNTMRWV